MRLNYALIILAGAAMAAMDVKPVRPGAEFQKRLDEYIKLRKKVVNGFAELKKKDDAALIEARQLEAAKAIQAARSGAKPGDILIAPAREQIVAIIRSEMKGWHGEPAKDAVKQGNPTAEGTPFVPKVNAIYPSNAPLSTVPATLLLRLPQLPKEMEYRFVGKTLIIYDVESGVLLDLLSNAIP